MLSAWQDQFVIFIELIAATLLPAQPARRIASQNSGESLSATKFGEATGV
jgi:hypothetical protein